jgi:hypothetical protein
VGVRIDSLAARSSKGNAMDIKPSFAALFKASAPGLVDGRIYDHFAKSAETMRARLKNESEFRCLLRDLPAFKEYGLRVGLPVAPSTLTPVAGKALDASLQRARVA